MELDHDASLEPAQHPPNGDALVNLPLNGRRDHNGDSGVEADRAGSSRPHSTAHIPSQASSPPVSPHSIALDNNNADLTQQIEPTDPEFDRYQSATSLTLTASQLAPMEGAMPFYDDHSSLGAENDIDDRLILPAPANLYRVVCDQLSNSYSARHPLFSDFFLPETYQRWSRPSTDLQYGDRGLAGAPKTDSEFLEWLRSGDPLFVQQHATACQVLSKLSSVGQPSMPDLMSPKLGESSSNRDDHFLEWNLAGAIVDSGLVCLIGPRNSGKSHLLRRVLHKLTHSSHRSRNTAYAFPRPILPLRVINLQALQTQDPFDLLLYVLEDLKAMLKLDHEDAVIGELRETLERGAEIFVAQSNDLYHESRLRLLREKYSEALNSLKKVITSATQRYQLVIVLEDFELLTGERQTFLYNLMDIISLGYRHSTSSRHTEDTMRSQFGMVAQSAAPAETSTPITAVMVTSCLDSFSMLEKRVASRFPQRQIIFDGHQSLASILKVVFQHLVICDLPLPSDRELLVERRKELKKHAHARSKADEDGGVTHSSQMSFTHEQLEALLKASEMPQDDEEFENGDEVDVEAAFDGNQPMWMVNKDDPTQDEILGPVVEALKDSNSPLSQHIATTRQLFSDWNAAVFKLFSNLPKKVIEALQQLFDFTTNVGDFFQVFLNTLARAPSAASLALTSANICDSVLEFMESAYGRLEVAISCSIVQLMLLIEMGRREQQLHISRTKDGGRLVDVVLPEHALAIDMGTAQQSRKKRKADGSFVIEATEPNRVSAARQDALSIKFYHFESIYEEYLRFAHVDTALTAFRLPKHIVRKEFEQLLALNLIEFTSLNRYHFQAHPPHVEPVSTVHQYLKCNLATHELELVVARYPEPLPDALKHRVRI